MRIFSGLNEAHNEIERDLFEVGQWVKGSTYQDKYIEGDTRFDFMELRPYVYSLTSTHDLMTFVMERGLSWDWIVDEFRERVTSYCDQSSNPGKAWKRRKEVWEEFLESDGSFSYTYPERFYPTPDLDQLTRVIAELKLRPASRQCIVSVFDAHKDLPNLGGKHRIPCSMFYHIMIRNERVDLHYVMRSCDFFTHFPYDQILAIKLQEYCAYNLDREVGIFHHMITSLHAFRKDFPEGVF